MNSKKRGESGKVLLRRLRETGSTKPPREETSWQWGSSVAVKSVTDETEAEKQKNSIENGASTK